MRCRWMAVGGRPYAKTLIINPRQRRAQLASEIAGMRHAVPGDGQLCSGRADQALICRNARPGEHE